MNTKGDCFYVYSKHISELNAGSKGSPRMLFSCKASEPFLNVYLGPVYFYLLTLCLRFRFRTFENFYKAITSISNNFNFGWNDIFPKSLWTH